MPSRSAPGSLFEGIDFGVTGRDVALGGQLLSVRGLAGDYDELFLPLHGEHMASNAAVAVAAVEAFLGGGERRLDPDVLRAGLAATTSPGRLEIVRRSPTVLVDAAHNPHGMRALRGALTDAFTFTTLVGVVAIFSDKPAAEMLEELEPVLDAVVVTRNSSPRSTPPRELGEVAVEMFGESRVHVVELPAGRCGHRCRDRRGRRSRRRGHRNRVGCHGCRRAPPAGGDLVVRGLVFFGRTGTFTWRMGATVLAAQSIAVFFGALVARGVSLAQSSGPATAYLLVGSALAVLCLIAAGLMRSPVGVTLGWLIQLATFVSAVVVPLMAAVGVIFTALWVTCLVQGARIDEAQARWAAQADQEQSPPG